LALFSLGQLCWGPIGDRFGRRGPIVAGLLFFIAGAAGCALSMTAGQMIGWRVVQAVGACAGVVLARAMVRDLYTRERAAQMLSILMTVMAIAPLLGPLVGVQILGLAGWRAIFWGLVAIGLLTLVAVLSLPETLPRGRRNSESLLRAAFSYAELVRSRSFVGYTMTGGFFYAGMFAFIAGSPAAFIDFYHVSPQDYAVIFALGIIGIMATSFLNGRLVARFGVDRLLRLGAIVATCAGVASGVAAWTGYGGLSSLAILLLAYFATAGLIIPNSISGALMDYPDRAGAASALVGALQYGSGIFGSALVGTLSTVKLWPLGSVVALGGLGSAACAWFRTASFATAKGDTHSTNS
jgi:DHA1 family bicyclomycin/chloramphenicol resistance-like MFS transporter